MTQLVVLSSNTLPAIIAVANQNAQQRFFEFFTVNIRNRNTLRAYGLAVREFMLWCEQHRVPSIAAVAPVPCPSPATSRSSPASDRRRPQSNSAQMNSELE